MQFASRKYNRNLSGSHYSTLGFGEVLPSWSCEQVIGDSVTIKPHMFLRSFPTYLPNMGNLSVSNRAFFCTYNSVWRYYEEFLQGNPVQFSKVQSYQPLKTTPTISRALFLQILSSNFLDVVGESSNSDVVAVVPVSRSTQVDEPYDFVLRVYNEFDQIANYVYYRLNNRGKQILKIFQSLDYNYNFILPFEDSEGTRIDYSKDELSALPLLCFFKVMYDYYLPSNLRPSSAINNLLYWVNNLWRPESPQLDFELLDVAFREVMLYHDSNYFTSQWLTPTEPAPYLSQFGSLVANQFDIEESNEDMLSPSNPSSINNDVNGLIQSNNYGTASSSTGQRLIADNISFEQIKVINQLRSFIMRNNLVGSLPIQRLFARFGVKVPELQLQMSQYFGNYDVPIQNDAVVSTNGASNEDGETSLADLGGMSYANQRNDHTFKFTCSQNGMSFVISSIDVPSSYVSGISRHLYHKTPFSFYTPEFDDSIMQATRGNEVVGRVVGLTHLTENALYEDNLTEDSIFGYCPRYSELKYGRNRVTGDYNIKTLRQPINGYILPRQVYDEDKWLAKVESSPTASLTAQNFKDLCYYTEFNPIKVLAQSDAVQFNRIYKDITGLTDPFQLEFIFDTQVHGNVKNSELDSFINGDGDTFEFEKNGGHVN